MKHQVQAKLLRHLGSLPRPPYATCFHCWAFKPLLPSAGTRPAIRSRASRLLVRKNQEGCSQGCEQAAHVANLLDNDFGRGRVGQIYRDKGTQQLQFSLGNSR